MCSQALWVNMEFYCWLKRWIIAIASAKVRALNTACPSDWTLCRVAGLRLLRSFCVSCSRWISFVQNSVCSFSSIVISIPLIKNQTHFRWGLKWVFKTGGAGGIRTHVPFHRQLDFESSSLCPLRYRYMYIQTGVTGSNIAILLFCCGSRSPKI